MLQVDLLFWHKEMAETLLKSVFNKNVNVTFDVS